MTAESPRRIELLHTEVRYRVTRSRRLKSVQLRIDVAHGLEVLLPRRLEGYDERPLLRRHARWILERLRRSEARRALGPRAVWTDGGEVPLFGHRCPLTVRVERDRGRTAARYRGGRVAVRAPIDASPDDLRSAVVALYRAIARETLESRVAHWSREASVRARSVTIREQATRWGSCSGAGRLSFNWRLVIAPCEILDYVAAHEVAHLVHFDHGPEWQGLLDRLMPDWRRWEDWLDRNGELLYLP
ncbi:MAG: SprT family zinc-dependent metalloprotease [Planctomycetota bacterium]